MALELSTSQRYTSSYEVVPGQLTTKLIPVAAMAGTEDGLEGKLIGADGAEERLRYRTRSSEHSKELEGESSPPRISSPSASVVTDEFVAIKVSFAGGEGKVTAVV